MKIYTIWYEDDYSGLITHNTCISKELAEREMLKFNDYLTDRGFIATKMFIKEHDVITGEEDPKTLHIIYRVWYEDGADIQVIYFKHLKDAKKMKKLLTKIYTYKYAEEFIWLNSSVVITE